IELSVESENDVSFHMKTVEADESEYWKFPDVTTEDNKHTTLWDTTSAPEGEALIKAVSSDDSGQFATVTSTLLVNNEADEVESPSWEPADNPPESIILGYVMGDSTYGSFNILRDLDASRLTHINYAFSYINEDFSIRLGDQENDVKNFNEFNLLKEQYPHLNTLISIGGYGGSQNFSDVAATEKSRTTFANNAVDFITEHSFDGIDLDWEYP